LDEIAERAGRRLRALRKTRGLTIAQVAEMSGFSEGHLSSLETGATSPTLSTLAILASAIGTEMAAFFPLHEREPVHIHRASDSTQVRMAAGKELYTLLSARSEDPTYNSVLEVLAASPEGTSYSFVGERFFLLLSGSLEIRIAATTYKLSAGDYIHYSTHPDHLLRITSSEPVAILWIMTPAVI